MMFLRKQLSLFNDGYTYGMLLLIISYCVLKKNRSNVKTFIVIGNSWFAIYFTTILFIFIKEITIAWYSQNPYEGYTFKYDIALFSPYGFALLGQYILIFMVGILFYYKILRAKIWLSIIAILSLCFSPIIIFFLSLYRNYLPSSFSYHRSNIFMDDILGVLFFIFLIVGTYFIKTKLKKEHSIQR